MRDCLALRQSDDGKPTEGESAKSVFSIRGREGDDGKKFKLSGCCLDTHTHTREITETQVPLREGGGLEFVLRIGQQPLCVVVAHEKKKGMRDGFVCCHI